MTDPFRSEGRADVPDGRSGAVAGGWAIGVSGTERQQVKVRGFRIELGEIEAALLELPGVEQAVVTAREDAPGQQKLVAYLKRSWQAGSTSNHELEDYRGGRLPEYMVPVLFMEID